METQNNINNELNPNQQPQPQKEEEKKKKNKVVAWWLGLGKWAKVGICAGTAAVLAAAITLPIVLRKDNSLIMTPTTDAYHLENLNLNKDTLYTFKANIPKKDEDIREIRYFYVTNAPESNEHCEMTYAEMWIDSNKTNWEYNASEKQLTGDAIKMTKNYNVTIKVKLKENVTNAIAYLYVGSGQ